MLFAFICLDKDGGSALRAQTRAAHLAYLEAVKDRIRIAGPILGEDGATPKGSILILEFAGPKEAAAFAAGDPYAKAGLFKTVTVAPFKQVLPQP